MLTVRISVNLVAREFLNNNEDIRHIRIRQTVKSILGLQPRDKAAMLGVKTKEYFLEEFT